VNIRSLTRGDGVVIGAAVLLFVASFLDFYSVDCSGQFCSKSDVPNAWDDNLFPVLPSIYLAGWAATGLILADRLKPSVPKVAGLGLGQWGVALAAFAAWSGLWTLIGGLDFDKGIGQILGSLAAVVLAAGAVLGTQLPALKAPLMGAQPMQAPSPYGANPGAGYGYPGQQAADSAPYGAQPGGQQQPYGGQQHQPGPAGAGAPAGQQGPAAGGDFAPFWFAVPIARPLFSEGGSPTPIAELTPGTWYLAVEQHGQALIAQTQDGRRGVLQDTAGIQRG
jgi:hypothetical protein